MALHADRASGDLVPREMRRRHEGGRHLAAIPHPVAIEVTAQAGLDFICIDWSIRRSPATLPGEPGAGGDVHRAPAMVHAASGHAPEATAAVLDAARGVLVPRVSTARCGPP